MLVSFPLAAVGIFGLLFCVYAVSRILSTWQYHDLANLAVWFILLGLDGGACIGLLFWVATHN